jgi:hypothetical protein
VKVGKGGVKEMKLFTEEIEPRLEELANKEINAKVAEEKLAYLLAKTLSHTGIQNLFWRRIVGFPWEAETKIVIWRWKEKDNIPRELVLAIKDMEKVVFQIRSFPSRTVKKEGDEVEIINKIIEEIHEGECRELASRLVTAGMLPELYRIKLTKVIKQIISK